MRHTSRFWQAVHDLIAHPAMALSGRSKWSVRLHAYSGFRACHADERNEPIGIIGPLATVDRVVETLVSRGAILCGQHGGDDGAPLDVALDVSELR